MNNLTYDNHKQLKSLYRTSIIIFLCLFLFCFVLYLCFKDNPNTASIVQLLYPEKNIAQLQLTEYALSYEPLLSEKITLFIKVFIHNSLVCLVVIMASYIPFCFFAQWAMLINCVLNVLILTTLSNSIGSFSYQFWINNVLLHGVPELIAFSIAYTIGFHICLDMTKLCVKNLKLKSLGYLSHPKTALKLYFFMIVPIVFIASFIEGFAYCQVLQRFARFLSYAL